MRAPVLLITDYAAVKVPETISHHHYWYFELTRQVYKDIVLDAFRSSTRIALINHSDGLSSNNTIKELMPPLTTGLHTNRNLLKSK